MQPCLRVYSMQPVASLHSTVHDDGDSNTQHFLCTSI